MLQKNQLNIYFLQEEIKAKFSEQRHLSKINQLEEKFNKKWEIWEHLFELLYQYIRFNKKLQHKSVVLHVVTCLYILHGCINYFDKSLC